MPQGIMDLFSLDEMKSVPQKSLKRASNRDIAVIGISAKLPMVEDIDEFWGKLALGTDFIGNIPEERKRDVEDYLNFIGVKKEKQNFEEAAYLRDIDKFDFDFFGLSPNEAALMDPNQRLFLETAWHAIEDAGYDGKGIVSSRTAVFVAFTNDCEYKKLIYDTAPDLYSISVPGNLPPIIASRISYLLDLKGTSMVVNTACSSSLVALHLGCQALRNGECSMAIIGSVQAHMLPIRQAEIGIESSNRRARSFDNSSDGTGGGEGVLAVILKPLDKALKDRDNIYAVIKGSACNQDGASVGISAPNPAAQEDVIVRAWQEAGIDPNTISYIEAHGTGTKLGDPIEIDGIQRAFKRYTDRKQFCAVGSVKSNIGHMDASAGLVGFLKAVLSLKNKQIPPSLHFNRPNAKVAFHKSPVYVNRKLRNWECGDFPRRCGVSSFGFSGTNCHVVLEEAPEMEKKPKSNNEQLRVFVVSAKTEDALKALLDKYLELNYDESELEDICYTAGIGRSHYNCRLAILSGSLPKLKEKLKKVLKSGLKNYNDEGIFFKKHKLADSTKRVREEYDITREEKDELQLKADSLMADLQSETDIDRSFLENICRLYVSGAEIEWSDLYRFEQLSKVRLPVYPFGKKRCWINIPYSCINTIDDYFFAPDWKLQKLNSVNCTKRKGSVLVVGTSEISTSIVNGLKLRGEVVVEARFADKYKKVNETLYYLGTREDDFKRLIDDIKAENLAQVVDVMPLCDTEDNKESGIEAKLNTCLYSFFYLIREMLKSNLKECDIVVIAQYANKVDGSEKSILSQNAALFGLGKVVNVEDFRIKCRSVDIDEDTAAESVVSEIINGYEEYNVAYRKGYRYIQQITKISVDNLENRKTEIKENGVYVITGGMGGLGLEVAKYLSTKNKVKLLLINRSTYPEKRQWESIADKKQDIILADKVSTLLEIEKSGSVVELYNADITKREDVRNILNEIRNKYKKIDGIVHSAAVGVGRQGRKLKEENLERFIEVIAPKVQGTSFLNEETTNDDLDFFVIFSSPITITGAIGSGSYTAANSYLDSFAASRNMFSKNTIAMGWAPWEKTLNSSKADFSGNKHMFEVISSGEIIKAFDRLLNKKIELAFVGKMNYKSDIFSLDGILPFRLSDSLKNIIEKYRAGGHANSVTGVDTLKNVILSGAGNGFYTETEKLVASVWGRILGYSEMNVHDNFYELGGDSIIAMKIINNINQIMGLNIKVTELLSNLTISKLAACIDKNRNTASNKVYLQIAGTENRDYYPVSMSQKRIFLLSSKIQNDTSWNISWAFILKGELDKDRFENAFKQLVKRHQIFRTSFSFVKGEPVQVISDDIEFNIVYQELNNRTIHEAAKGVVKHFDLSKAPLLRGELIRINDSEHLLLFDIHHIIADAASIQVLLSEIISLYKGIKLPELPVQYRDFSVWQNNLVASGAFKNQEEYWLNKFSGDIPVLNLPLDYPRGEDLKNLGHKINFEINKDLTCKLSRIAVKTGTSLFTVLLSNFLILLWKFSSQKEINVGVPVSGRTHSDLEKLIGMFVNIIVVNSTLNGEKSFIEFLSDVNVDFMQSYANCDYPFFELINKLGIKTDANRNPLFDASFVMQNTGSQEIDFGSGLRFIPYDYENAVSRNDILLEGIEDGNKIRFIFEYNSNLFKKSTIESLIDFFIKIIGIVCEDYSVRLADIEFLSQEEKSEILDDFNDDLEFQF